ncbi:Endophilin-A1, partial [Neolecta irregularis DAH-3]
MDPAEPALRVRALYDFTPDDTGSLAFSAGDEIQVLTQLESGWWDGMLGGTRGWFPSNYVAVLDDDDGPDEDAAAYWIPQATPEGRIYYFNTRTEASTWEIPFERMDGARPSSALSPAARSAPRTIRMRPPVDPDDAPVLQKLHDVAMTANRLSILTSLSAGDALPHAAFQHPPPVLAALHAAVVAAVAGVVALATSPSVVAPSSITTPPPA